MLDPKMLEKLKGMRLVQGFTDEELKQFGEIASERKCIEGETIIAADDNGKHLYLILRGGLTVSVEGRELRRFGPGEIVGEMAFLDSRPSSAEAVTNCPSTLVGVAYQDLERLQQKYPDIEVKIQHNLAALLSERLRLTTEQFLRGKKALAFVCHDRQKNNLKELVQSYRRELSSFQFMATAGTAMIIEETLGVKVDKVAGTLLCGDVQIAARVVSGDILAVFFLRDPFLSARVQDRAEMLVQVCDTHNVPIATNLASAELLIRGMISLGNEEENNFQ